MGGEGRWVLVPLANFASDLPRCPKTRSPATHRGTHDSVRGTLFTPRVSLKHLRAGALGWAVFCHDDDGWPLLDYTAHRDAENLLRPRPAAVFQLKIRVWRRAGTERLIAFDSGILKAAIGATFLKFAFWIKVKLGRANETPLNRSCTVM